MNGQIDKLILLRIGPVMSRLCDELAMNRAAINLAISPNPTLNQHCNESSFLYNNSQHAAIN
jgi:hypothetical protein